MLLKSDSNVKMNAVKLFKNLILYEFLFTLNIFFIWWYFWELLSNLIVHCTVTRIFKKKKKDIFISNIFMEEKI